MELSRMTEVFYILIGELVTQGWTFIQISPDLGEAVKKIPSKCSECPGWLPLLMPSVHLRHIDKKKVDMATTTFLIFL